MIKKQAIKLIMHVLFFKKGEISKYCVLTLLAKVHNTY